MTLNIPVYASCILNIISKEHILIIKIVNRWLFFGSSPSFSFVFGFKISLFMNQ